MSSVFLVLPPNRLDAYSCWLRLLVAEALQDIARDAERPGGAQRPQEPPGGLSGPLTHPEDTEGATDTLRAALWPAERLKTPALFLLDEFAALGRLEAVERAMGLMAGYGIQLWPILQDMSQLKDLYGTRAGTFIANAGVQQVFGVNDLETAKWLSHSIGQQTTAYRSISQKPGEFDSTTTSVTDRDLLTRAAAQWHKKVPWIWMVAVGLGVVMAGVVSSVFWAKFGADLPNSQVIHR